MNSLSEGQPTAEATVHIFDVCGTLFVEDTTVGLLLWHFGRRRALARVVAVWLLFSRRSPFHLVLRVVEFLARRHLAKHIAISLLAGEPIAELEASAQQYAGHLLETKTIAPVFDRLLTQRSRSRVILASASLEPLVSALCQRLDIQGVGSPLGHSCGLLTGKISKDLTGRKIDALVEAFGNDLFTSQACGYSDNLSDRDLLVKCAYRVVILHRPRDRARWDLKEAHYLRLFAREDLPETAS
jgi:phosphoserine phosphatase